MSLEELLLTLEDGFWTGGAEVYRQNVDERCLLAFTEMAGVSTREEIAEMTGDGQRWRDLAIEPKGLLRPTEDVAVLSYEARATRANGEPYHALVSSAYVHRDDGWKLVFHQQTPLD